jgi:hypothetical protein
MNRIEVETKELPTSIKRIIGSARSVSVVIQQPGDAITITSQQWDGGSRDLWTAVVLSGGEAPVVDDRPWPHNMHQIGSVQLQPGCVMVRTGTFCGKPSHPTVYALAGDVSPMLPEPAPELNQRQQMVLSAICSYNSKGRERFRSDFKMSRALWDQTVAELAELGLVTKRGAATVKGKNCRLPRGSSELNYFSNPVRFNGFTA